MFKTFAAALVCVLTSQAADDFTYRYSGKHYHSWDAKHKWERMVAELEADTAGIQDYRYNELGDIFKQKSNRTTCHTGDELPG